MPALLNREDTRWVSETVLPLWLVKTYEEKARREAAIQAAKAQRDAERVRARACRLSCSRGPLAMSSCI